MERDYRQNVEPTMEVKGKQDRHIEIAEELTDVILAQNPELQNAILMVIVSRVTEHRDMLIEKAQKEVDWLIVTKEHLSSINK